MRNRNWWDQPIQAGGRTAYDYGNPRTREEKRDAHIGYAFAGVVCLLFWTAFFGAIFS